MATKTVISPEAVGQAEPPGKLKRYRELTQLLLKYGGREVVDRLRLTSYVGDKDEDMTVLGTELAADLERLGPAYVKLGQILSSRSDLLPEPILDQLARLEDNVEPMTFEMVRAVVEEETGRPLADVFASFEETPIGSASLAQVHAALLKDGRLVAVKVQRVGVADVIALDIDILREFASFFEKRTDAGRRYRVSAIVEEFNTTITREIDYEIEAASMKVFHHNLEEFHRITVPQPVEELCTPRLLVMNFVSGKKVSAIGPLIQMNMDGRAMADELLKAYLKQVFVDGFFHADPHPGNVFLVDSEHLALLDFGLVGRFAPRLRRKLLQMLPAIYELDTEEMVELTLEIGETEEPFDRAELKRRYGEIGQNSQAASIQQIQVSRVLFDVVRAASDCGVILPPEMSTLGRTLLHLDRVGRYIAPDFDVNAAIQSHVSEIAQREMIGDASPNTFLKTLLEAKELAVGLPRRVNRVLDALLHRQLGMRIDVVPEAHLLENLEKIANRITMGLILASLIIGASQLMQVRTQFVLFGYPGFAMICFAGALLGGLALVFGIIRADRKTRGEVPSKRV